MAFRITKTVHIDFETRSACNLKKAGLYRYAEDPTTEIMCVVYRIGLGSLTKCILCASPPYEILKAISDGYIIKAHNAAFERVIAAHKWGIYVDPSQMECTLAKCNAMNLPASLEGAGLAVEASVLKSEEGHALMMAMCKPRKIETDGTIVWWWDEDRVNRLVSYCATDVESEEALDEKVPRLTPYEREVWILDQRINDRGFAIDLERVQRAQNLIEQAKGTANARIASLTGGMVRKTTETGKIVKWLNHIGLPAESVKEQDREDLMVKADLLNLPVAKEVVELRQSSVKATKFKSMLETVCRDRRIRGTLVYSSTLSHRWAGRVPQPHNMKRIETEEDERLVAITIKLLDDPNCTPAMIELMTGRSCIEMLSLCARPMIVAALGCKLYNGDFSNIEGRINAWLNGEEWKLQAFRDYDAGIGPDLYRVMASDILGKPIDAITKDDRQLWGKVPDLSCGYQGGLAAFHRTAAKYGMGISDETATRVVRGYRARHQGIVAGWAELQETAIEATRCKGVIVSALGGQVKYIWDGGVLYCQLPNGHIIPYPGAFIERKEKTVIIDGDPVTFNNWGISFFGEKRGWRKLDLYGGMQMAHVVSGTAREKLAKAMLRVEAANYPVVLTVHDELLSEVPADFGSVAHYKSLMEEKEEWERGLPVTAKVNEGYRYDK